MNLMRFNPASFKKVNGIWMPKYGYLYNWYAVTDVRGIGNNGFAAPTDAEWTWLENYITAEISAGRITATGVGGALKETGFVYWNDPNTGAVNAVGFNARGGGGRSNNGTFVNIGNYGYWWSSTESSTDNAWYRFMTYDNGNVNRSNGSKQIGFSVRLIRPATPAEKAALADGDFAGKYTGNDGKEYGLIYIGKNHLTSDGYVIMSSNLAETKFADLSDIPNVEDNTDWANLTTAGRCAFNNNEEYV